MSGNIAEKDPWEKIKKFYLSVPFGSMPKTNIDAFIYGLLEEEGFFAGCKTTQDIAIKLRISPTKVRNLMLNSVLQDGFNVKVENILECIGSSARYLNDDLIAITIDNPVVKMELKRICTEQKIFTDSSFNNNILKFPIEKYDSLLKIFLQGYTEKDLTQDLMEQIKEAKWDIKEKEIAKSPFLTILQKGASLATGGVTDIVPTEIITKAIIKFLRIKENFKTSK